MICEGWFEETSNHNEDWDTFKKALLEKDAIKDSETVIMTELRTFKMTGTIEEYIVTYFQGFLP
ncbi:hypothetical protein DSO57_1015290 [Entomophthora muscae]|uniref:Uncharacterized protein n=1 Tax=Entomophthora muscae TaxID=34485 RepID=A0ACC2SU25_9FUNG|nr:hypothetical protein DSO57_1015290 [Entomophthora muscae]